ncbi:MAG: hypothetical protein ABS939_12215 [Psychrobacillus sp.]
MDIQTVMNIFFIILLVIGIISFFSGFAIMTISKNHKNGFFFMFVLSLILLLFLLEWFQSVGSEVFLATIPWLLNQAFAIILYILYLIVAWFILKRLNKRNLVS